MEVQEKQKCFNIGHRPLAALDTTSVTVADTISVIKILRLYIKRSGQLKIHLKRNEKRVQTDSELQVLEKLKQLGSQSRC